MYNVNSNGTDRIGETKRPQCTQSNASKLSPFCANEWHFKCYQSKSLLCTCTLTYKSTDIAQYCDRPFASQNQLHRQRHDSTHIHKSRNIDVIFLFVVFFSLVLSLLFGFQSISEFNSFASFYVFIKATNNVTGVDFFFCFSLLKCHC